MTLQKQTKIALIAIIAVAIGVPAAYAVPQLSIDDYCDPEPTSTIKAKYWLCLDLHPRVTALESITLVNGTDGVDGQDGADGAQGLQGIQGIQGEQGLQGIQGEQGPAGVSEIGQDFRLSQQSQGLAYSDFLNAPRTIDSESFNFVPFTFVAVEIDVHHEIYQTSVHDTNFQETKTLVANGVSPVDVTIDIWYWLNPSNPDITIIDTCTVNAGQVFSVCNADNLSIPAGYSVGSTFTVDQQLPSDPAFAYESIFIGSIVTASITN